MQNGKVAEWSKALALGASPKGRGFEPHLYQIFFLSWFCIMSIVIHDFIVVLDMMKKLEVFNPRFPFLQFSFQVFQLMSLPYSAYNQLTDSISLMFI